MPARDIFHHAVRHALESEGWAITDDPYYIKFGEDDLYIDLAAEKTIAACKDDRRIAVEIKSFSGPSLITDFHHALGQFLDYRLALNAQESDRVLYLALPEDAWELIARRDLPQAAIREFSLKILVYDPGKEVIIKWLD